MGNKKGGPTKNPSKKVKNELTTTSKKTEGSKKSKLEVPKIDKKKGKNTGTAHKPLHDQKTHKENKPEPRKGPAHHPTRNASLKKPHKKSIEKNKGEEKNKKTIDVEASKTRSTGSCFLCFCCCGENDDLKTELLLEEERRKEEEAQRKKEEEEARKKKEEEEARRKKEEEEARRKREEEEARRKREEAEARKRAEEEEATKVSDYHENVEDETIKDEATADEPPKKAVLKKIGIKAKQPPRKAKLNFIGAAAAPPPPAASACVGNPPQIKSTNVKLGEGVYLVYDSKTNNGQLKVCYSKTAIRKNGVLAYISSQTIPPFYFEKNNGETVVVNNVSQLMQSSFINDRKPYYENWIEFIRKTKQFDGVLYLLPAANVEPPPKMEIVFLNSKEKKIYHLPIEKPVHFQGDYLLAIHNGLDVFKKEINTTDILAYIGSYGAYAEL